MRLLPLLCSLLLLAPIAAHADAGDPDGSVRAVVFSVDGEEVARDRSSPFRHRTTALSEGSHRLAARAVDDDGAYSEQQDVSISVETSTSPGPDEPSDHVSVTPEADAYVRGGKHAETNYGGEPDLYVKTSPETPRYTRYAYLRFDVTSFEGSVHHASLRIHPYSTGSSSQTNLLRSVSDEDWSEDALTWANRPALGDELDRWEPEEGRTIEIDVTELVQQARTADGTVTFAIVAPSSYEQSDGNDWVRYGSRDGQSQSRPELAIRTDPSGPRVTEGLEALYRFDEGSGSLVRNDASSDETLDLEIKDEGAVSWTSGGLRIDRPTRIVSQGSAGELNRSLVRNEGITVEAWLNPASLGQDGPARILTLSKGPFQRNVTLGQGRWNDQPSDVIDVRLRTTERSSNGRPSVTTSPGSLANRLVHVVYTRAADGQARIYLNGEIVTEETVDGTLTNWNEDYRLALANEVGADRPWLGTLELSAIYSRALTASQVRQNFEAGSGGSSPEARMVADETEQRIGKLEAADTPDRLTLESNVPNPFNPTTTIAYALPRQAPVRLEVYDLLGRRVRLLVDRVQGAGRHTVRFEASGLPSGTYLYVLRAGPTTRTGRMMLVK
jgi:hypothetical protein